MEPDIDAAFEALFTDEFWREWCQEAQEHIALSRTLLRATNTPDTGLVDHLEQHLTERPAYLANVSPSDKEVLRQHYHAVYADAKRIAESMGTCPSVICQIGMPRSTHSFAAR
jgi:hypothetical protein